MNYYFVILNPYVALPIAHALYNKGAKLTVIFTFLGASAQRKNTEEINFFMRSCFNFQRLRINDP